jgi:hypothetical protein
MTTFEALSLPCKRWLAEEVARSLNALSSDPPHSAWLSKHVDNLLWYWSVDRMRRGRVCRDAIPQGGGEGGVFASAPPHWHTRRALDAHQGVRSKLIRRDHVVPKKVLLSILRSDDGAKKIEQVLDRYCFVAFIHVEEDEKLNKAGLKEQMPTGWDTPSLLTRDPWARYRKVGLDAIISPPVPALGKSSQSEGG